MMYNVETDTPLMWWYTCEDQFGHLQELAIKLFSIVPHSVSCERNFSNLGWFHSRRYNLSLETLENLSKIHNYYIYNNKKEIAYYGNNLTEDEIRKVITDLEIDQGFDEIEDDKYDDSNDEDDEDNEDDEESDGMEDDDLGLSGLIEPLLQIGDVMDLNQEVFLEDKFDESSSESGSDQISITQSLDYDPKQLVLNIISDDDEINHEGNNNIYLNNMHPLFILYSNHL